MTNCLFFALALYWRRRKKAKRCYFMFRASILGCGPHFLYAEQRRSGLRIISFKPLDTRHKDCPPPLFKGRACWGDSL
jgi:hypothetical protein